MTQFVRRYVRPLRRSGPRSLVFDLQRFVAAQSATYDAAKSELQHGRKVTHWMWFVVPQIAGLGRSSMAQFYAISGREEAVAYLAHPVLGPRIRACARIVAETEGRSAKDIFGLVDATKLRSSMILFWRVDPDDPSFKAVLDRYFDGQTDAATDERL